MCAAPPGSCWRFGVSGGGFEVWGLGCRVSGFEFRVQGSEFRGWCLGSRFEGLGCCDKGVDFIFSPPPHLRRFGTPHGVYPPLRSRCGALPRKPSSDRRFGCTPEIWKGSRLTRLPLRKALAVRRGLQLEAGYQCTRHLIGPANVQHNRDMVRNVTGCGAFEDAIPCGCVAECETLHRDVGIAIAS